MDQFNHNKADDRDILLQNAGSSLGDHSEESGGSPARYLTYADRERRKIREALQDNGGNRQLTAKALGISTTTIWRRMQKYGLRSDEQ